MIRRPGRMGSPGNPGSGTVSDIFSDAFAGDVADLASRSGWTRVQGPSGDATTSSGRLNSVSANTDDATTGIYLSTAPTGPAYFVEANFKLPVGGQGPWVMASYVDRDNFVGFRLHSDGSAQVFEKVGSYTSKISVSGTTDDQLLRCEVDASWLLTLYRAGVSIGTPFTINAAARGIKPGIFTRQFAITGFIDNFRTGSL